jgi:hypothetical protein
MAVFILRVEGVDFDATIEDTQNLSTYRGASLALLAAPQAVERYLSEEAGVKGVRKIFAGASQGAVAFEANDMSAAELIRGNVEAYLRRELPIDPRAPNPPFAALSFVIDVAPGDDLAALRQAEAKNRARQFTHETGVLPPVAPPTKGMSGPDQAALDRVRPATCSLYVPPGKVLSIDADAPTPTSDRALTSFSFAARHVYGRRKRQEFYGDHGAPIGAGLSFTNSLEDMIAEPPDDLPPSVRQKVAVVYCDGNGFGKIRDASKDLPAYVAFSDDVLAKQGDLLRRIVAWLQDGVARAPQAFAVDEKVRGEAVKGLRFETLMWGGDELCFVMPAWLGLAFVEVFRKATAGWNHCGKALTHGIGVVFCDHKTPIRLSRRVAKLIADKAKTARRDEAIDVLQIEAFESIALPETEEQFNVYRRALFGAGPIDDDLDSALTLKGEAIGVVLAQIAKLKKEALFPRSQIYKLLRIAAQEGGFAKPTAGEDPVKKATAAYLTHAGAESKIRAPEDLMILGDQHSLALSLAVIASLWDYVGLPPEEAT